VQDADLLAREHHQVGLADLVQRGIQGVERVHGGRRFAQVRLRDGAPQQSGNAAVPAFGRGQTTVGPGECGGPVFAAPLEPGARAAVGPVAHVLGHAQAGVLGLVQHLARQIEVVELDQRLGEIDLQRGPFRHVAGLSQHLKRHLDVVHRARRVALHAGERGHQAVKGTLQRAQAAVAGRSGSGAVQLHGAGVVAARKGAGGVAGQHVRGHITVHGQLVRREHLLPTRVEFATAQGLAAGQHRLGQLCAVPRGPRAQASGLRKRQARRFGRRIALHSSHHGSHQVQVTEQGLVGQARRVLLGAVQGGARCIGLVQQAPGPGFGQPGPDGRSGRQRQCQGLRRQLRGALRRTVAQIPGQGAQRIAQLDGGGGLFQCRFGKVQLRAVGTPLPGHACAWISHE